ncbi:hypothetical protein CARUB_v10007498mg [Capsella rubella]|uniref:C2H2-type domain-containing protein n=1 Tax=Capsella rubella TaxID=81985 RepID=R0H2J1_9BRAS|nr:uncharacterized protein LOC17880279 [Capsella rubella]EOA18875.1 hypothetical protein CARUB_v10007498mg [Capsella rubella]
MTDKPEKMKAVDDTDGERDVSDEQLSDDESETREIVLGLPALSITSRIFGDLSSVSETDEEEAPMKEQDEAALKEQEEACSKEQEEACSKEQEEAALKNQEQVRLNEQAVVAAELVMAMAEEAVMKGKSDEGGSGGKMKKKKSRPRTSTKTDDEADGSGTGEAKKPKKKGSQLNHPPKGPPVCHICDRAFGSWKAVFGHMRAHRDRSYQGFLPPPTFSAAAEMIAVPGRKSAFVLLTAGGGSSGGNINASGGGIPDEASASGVGRVPGEGGGRSLGLDLNAEPVEKGEEATESGSIAKFDLNKSPPKDDDDEKNGN